MIEWWGPVIHEYYSGTEGLGMTWITSEEALAHPGSVGRAIWGEAHVCGEDGQELPTGEDGVVYFGSRAGVTFEYNGDPEKTRQSFNDKGWATLWDVGHLDDDGYLYLTDRKQFMIVSGGVNIYPQEIEAVLVLHPAVADVAVFGVPEPEMGEEVKAVVQPAPGITPGPELEQEILDFLPRPPQPLQVPPHCRVHGPTSPGRERQALQEALTRCLLGELGPQQHLNPVAGLAHVGVPGQPQSDHRAEQQHRRDADRLHHGTN